MITGFLKSAGFPIFLLLASCGSEDVGMAEKKEIQVMDSTANAISDTTKMLEMQTEKVEASLEKLNEAFDNDN